MVRVVHAAIENCSFSSIQKKIVSELCNYFLFSTFEDVQVLEFCTTSVPNNLNTEREEL